jgi:hypothetical protein
MSDDDMHYLENAIDKSGVFKKGAKMKPKERVFTCSATQDLTGVCELCGERLNFHGSDYECMKQKESKHTPLPWKYENGDILSVAGDCDGDDYVICGIGVTSRPRSGVFGVPVKKESLANGEFIVQAVSSHEALKRLVKIAISVAEMEAGCSDGDRKLVWQGYADGWKEALAKAEGRS